VPTYRYVVVDVFTDTALAGNQLAVFTDAREIPRELMQALAKEIGYSETTFVLPAERGGTVRVRIFTPDVELPLAGHPILGTAWVLAQPLQRATLELETGMGTILVELDRDESGAVVFARMTQPVPTVEPYPEPAALLEALGVERSLLPIERYYNGVQHTFVALGSADDVAGLRPNLPVLADLGVKANCFAGAGTSWKTRMFAPSVGVAEDAGTGSAAGPLACHVCRHGLVEWGEWIEISQGVELGRPSTLFARAEAAGGEIARVFCGGRAVVVARGEFRL
jgi:trans-2,3-dihydro-3-hydroxyanthranilate isomerase